MPKILKETLLIDRLSFARYSTSRAEKQTGTIAIKTSTNLPFSKPNKSVAGINTDVKNIPMARVISGTAYIGIELTKSL